jgi:hypothetical protein
VGRCHPMLICIIHLNHPTRACSLASSDTRVEALSSLSARVLLALQLATMSCPSTPLVCTSSPNSLVEAYYLITECRECKFCKSGKTNLCSSGEHYDTPLDETGLTILQYESLKVRESCPMEPAVSRSRARISTTSYVVNLHYD